MQPGTAAAAGQRGALLVTLLVVLVPLLLLVAGATTLMTGRNGRLLQSMQLENALHAAEAGIEEAAQRANSGTLVAGQTTTRDFGGGVSCSWRAESLLTNGIDDDADGMVDEADERAFAVVATGRQGRSSRCLSAVLVEPASLPGFRAAILALGTPTISTKGSSRVSGLDTRINGQRAIPAADVAGIATEPPHDTAGLMSHYTRNGGATVVGAPNFSTTPAPYNLPGLLATAHNSVRNWLAPETTRGDFGNANANDWQVSYSRTSLKLAGNRRGAGLLVVAGDLDITGTVRFDGLVVVLGKLTMSGTALINGAVIQGPAGSEATLIGNATVRYSTEALGHLAALLRPGYAIVNWREIARP